MPRVARLSLALAVILALLLPAAVAAQDTDDDRGLVIRINGNATVAEGEDTGLAVVINGNLDVLGTAESVVIVNGTATIAGGRVSGVLAVNSTLNLTDGAVVEEDVSTVNSTVNQTNGTIGGEIREWEPERTWTWLAPMFAFFSLVFLIGGALLVLLAGLLAAAIAPTSVRRTGWLISADLGNTILAGLAFWFLLPLVAVIAFVTLVGMPIGFALLFGVLPVVAALGTLVAGIRFGDWLVLHLRGAVEPQRPYLASFLGLGALVLLGVVPFVGGLLWLVATFLGSGAITLIAWRSMRGRPWYTPRPVVAAAAPATGSVAGWYGAPGAVPPGQAAPVPLPAAVPPAAPPPSAAPAPEPGLPSAPEPAGNAVADSAQTATEPVEKATEAAAEAIDDAEAKEPGPDTGA